MLMPGGAVFHQDSSGDKSPGRPGLIRKSQKEKMTFLRSLLLLVGVLGKGTHLRFAKTQIVDDEKASVTVGGDFRGVDVVSVQAK